MKAYLLAATGVIFLSVVVSLLIPEGKLHKSVTFVMRIICLLVLIQPITGIFKIKDVETSEKDFFDYEYVCGIYSEHQSEQLEILIDKEFEATTDCKVTVNYADGNFKVSEIEVQLQENNPKLIKQIYAYLDGLGYINITVYAKSS
jgi:hypothetical protein